MRSDLFGSSYTPVRLQWRDCPPTGGAAYHLGLERPFGNALAANGFGRRPVLGRLAGAVEPNVGTRTTERSAAEPTTHRSAVTAGAEEELIRCKGCYAGNRKGD